MGKSSAQVQEAEGKGCTQELTFSASLLFFRFAKNGAGLRGIGNFIFLKFHSSFPSFLCFPLTYQELGKAAKVKLFHHSSHFKGSSSIKL